MTLTLVPVPAQVTEQTREARRKNPRGSVKRDPGGIKIKIAHVFETTGAYRLVTRGVKGPWLRGPAERPER